MFAIRNIAVKEGNVPAGVIAQARNLIKTGRVVNLTSFMMRKRQKMGLSKGPSTATEDVQKILKKTALDKIVASGTVRE
jgi:heterodisulfide reductase subunit C